MSQFHLFFGRNLKASKIVGRLYSGTRGRCTVCPDWRLLAQGRQRQANWKQSILCDQLGVCIWFSLGGHKLKGGTKIRKAVGSLQSQSCGANFKEVIGQLPRLLLELSIRLPASLTSQAGNCRLMGLVSRDTATS